MKKILLVIVSVIVSVSMMAQKADGKERVSREQFAEIQAKHIAKEVGLDEATTAKYVQTYCEYQKEVWQLGPRKQQGNDAESDIKARFERSQKILSLREKYYEKYSKFMTQEQIKKAYQLEKKSMERMKQHHGGAKVA